MSLFDLGFPVSADEPPPTEDARARQIFGHTMSDMVAAKARAPAQERAAQAKALVDDARSTLLAPALARYQEALPKINDFPELIRSTAAQNYVNGYDTFARHGFFPPRVKPRPPKLKSTDADEGEVLERTPVSIAEQRPTDLTPAEIARLRLLMPPSSEQPPEGGSPVPPLREVQGGSSTMDTPPLDSASPLVAVLMPQCTCGLPQCGPNLWMGPQTAAVILPGSIDLNLGLDTSHTFWIHGVWTIDPNSGAGVSLGIVFRDGHLDPLIWGQKIVVPGWPNAYVDDGTNPTYDDLFHHHIIRCHGGGGGGGGGNGNGHNGQPPPCPPPCPPVVNMDDLCSCLADAIRSGFKELKEITPLPITFGTRAQRFRPTGNGDAVTAASLGGQRAAAVSESFEDEEEVPLVSEPGGPTEGFSNVVGTAPPELAGTGAAGLRLSHTLTEVVRSLAAASSGGGEVPGCDVSRFVELFSFDWNSPAICEAVAELRKCQGQLRLGVVLQVLGIVQYRDGPPEPGNKIAFLFDAALPAPDESPSVWKNLERSALVVLHNFLVGVINAVDGLLGAAVPSVVCATIGKVLRMVAEGVRDFLIKWTGMSIGALTASADMTLTAMCPRHIPTGNEANLAYLHGQISYDVWQCWVTANDQLPWPAERVLLAEQRLPTEGALIQMRRRGLISAEEYGVLMRRHGWLDGELAEAQFTISTEIPGPSDLIRMMLRHVEFEDVIKMFDLYAEFPQAYKGRLKEWFGWQGVPNEVALYQWAAHWANIPFGQLQEMYFRLRPEKYGDKVDPKGYPMVVTPEIVYQGLRENDVPPFWRYKLIEVKHRLPRLIDLRNAYTQGKMSEEELRSNLLDRGHRPEDLDFMVDLFDRQQRTALRRSEFVRDYITGGLSEQLLRVELEDDGYSEALVNSTVTYARIKAQVASRKRCLMNLRKRVMKGELAAGELPPLMTHLGFDPTVINAEVTAIQCEFATAPKTLTRVEVMQAFTLGVIPLQETVARLVRLGLSLADAEILLAGKEIKSRKKPKVPTFGMTCDLVYGGALPFPQGIENLVALGYTREVANQILSACIAKKKARKK